MLKKAVIFTVLLCFGISNLCFADSSRMLDKNTELHPQPMPLRQCSPS